MIMQFGFYLSGWPHLVDELQEDGTLDFLREEAEYLNIKLETDPLDMGEIKQRIELQNQRKEEFLEEYNKIQIEDTFINEEED